MYAHTHTYSSAIGVAGRILRAPSKFSKVSSLLNLPVNITLKLAFEKKKSQLYGNRI